MIGKREDTRGFIRLFYDNHYSQAYLTETRFQHEEGPLSRKNLENWGWVIVGTNNLVRWTS